MLQEFLEASKLTGIEFSRYIESLKASNKLEAFLPEISIMDNFQHSYEHHPEGNCFNHVMAALKQNKFEDQILNFAILLHDVGKPQTYRFNNNKHTYYGHESYGVPIVEKICNRLKLSDEITNVAKFCCENHMRFHLIKEMRIEKVQKLISHQYFNYLKLVSEADTKCRLHAFNQDNWNDIIYKIESLK